MITMEAPVARACRRERPVRLACRDLVNRLPDIATNAESLPPMRVTENANDFRIFVPIGDVDLRRVWIFATPRSVCIEVRSRMTIAHPDTACREVDDQRVVRELKLSHSIREGCTSVVPVANELEIICCKDPREDDGHWVEMVQFDTRASIGCV